MAKKNSTKTATEKAWSASEPRIINFGQWTGINIKEAPLGWTPLTDEKGDSNLPDNFLMLQNNVVTTSIKALETRLDTVPVCEPPIHYEEGDTKFLAFTGVVHLYEDKLFCAFETMRHAEEEEGGGIVREDEIDNQLYYYQLEGSEEHELVPYNPANWHHVEVTDVDEDQRKIEITSINTYANTLIVLTRYQDEVLADGQGKGEIFTGPLDDLDAGVSSALYIPDPTTAPSVYTMGAVAVDTSDDPVCRVTFVYSYSNRFGPTNISEEKTILINCSPVEFNHSRYLRIAGFFPTDRAGDYDITGVDIYSSADEQQDMFFIGHVDVKPTDTSWSYNWFGSINDTTQWTSISTSVPMANDTKGVDANYVRVHDGRLFFHGGSIPNRLYIGGDPGHELSVSCGAGGGFIDLDPGTGLVINATHKFKTYNGASIVTIMCGNKNTGAVKRFNLLETNLTVTNDLQAKGYEAEEVANVIGCNSHWGSGVWADGLYALSRYGLGITTQQMEESNTLKVNYLSDAIQPIFTSRISKQLSDARLMCCDEILYFALAVPGRDNDEPEHQNHQGLDKIIFAYDINQKAWYTLSYENTTENEIIHLFSFDYEQWWEGIGIVTPGRIDRIPVTGPHSLEPPDFVALIETGELGLRIPPQLYIWLAQIELRFDYLVGDLEFEIFGIDYYGREYKVYHKESTKNANGEYEIKYEYPVWIRVDKNVQTYRMRIKGKAHFRLTHFMSKTYQQSDKMAIQYGYDSLVNYMGRDGKTVDDHHYLDSYNNLRDAIVT